MFVKVEFDMTKKTVEYFDSWLNSKPDWMKATVMSNDQIIN